MRRQVCASLTFAGVVGLVLLAGSRTAAAAPIIFSASGSDPASIQATVDAYRAVFGGVNNGNTAGTQADGRREINWDGGGAAAPSTTFPNPQTTFSARGNVNTSPGGAVAQSGAPLPEFGEINPTYPDIFQTFSAPRLFAPIGSNITDVHFTVPGTTDVPAMSRGFGAVFTDVDLANVTSLEAFDPFGASLGTFFVPTANNGLSFLGLQFTDAFIGRVRITTGNAALGPNDGGGTDVVAMDDFIYGEPTAVPEPSTLLLVGLGVGAALSARRRGVRP
jgi:hypothetical protein